MLSQNQNAYVESKVNCKDKRPYEIFFQHLNKAKLGTCIDQETLIKFVKENPIWHKPGTYLRQLKYVKGYLWFLKVDNKLVEKEVEKYNAIVAASDSNKTTDKVPNAKDLIKKWRKFTFKTDNDKLLLGLVLFRMNVRGDIMDVKCDDIDTATDKYVDFENKKIVYNFIDKTKNNEKREFVVEDDELWALIEKKRGETYLVWSGHKTRKGYLSKRLAVLCKNVFGKKNMGLNECRKSTENSANLDATLDDQLDNAHRNGHSVNTFARNYKRVVEKEQVEVEVEVEVKVEVVEDSNDSVVMELLATAMKLKCSSFTYNNDGICEIKI